MLHFGPKTGLLSLELASKSSISYMKSNSCFGPTPNNVFLVDHPQTAFVVVLALSGDRFGALGHVKHPLEALRHWSGCPGAA